MTDCSDFFYMNKIYQVRLTYQYTVEMTVDADTEAEAKLRAEDSGAERNADDVLTDTEILYVEPNIFGGF